MRVSVDERATSLPRTARICATAISAHASITTTSDLTVEFKQVTNGNSGLFSSTSFVEGGYKNNIVNGWQCEVAPKGYDTGGIYESYGRGWLVQIPDEKESILGGRVEHARLRVEGNKVQTWLNGEPMIEIEDELIGNTPGRIMPRSTTATTSRCCGRTSSSLRSKLHRIS